MVEEPWHIKRFVRQSVMAIKKSSSGFGKKTDMSAKKKVGRKSSKIKKAPTSGKKRTISKKPKY